MEQHGHHKTGDSRTALQNTGRPNYLLSMGVGEAVRACHGSCWQALWLSLGERQRWKVCIDSVCVCAQSGHRETQSVSLLIKWKQAFYFVSLAGEGGKQAVIISRV